MDNSATVNFNDITKIYVREITKMFEKQINDNNILETENKELKNSIEILNYRLNFIKEGGKCTQNV